MKWRIVAVDRFDWEGRYDVHIKADVGHEYVISTINCKDELEAYTNAIVYIKNNWGDNAYEHEQIQTKWRAK